MTSPVSSYYLNFPEEGLSIRSKRWT